MIEARAAQGAANGPRGRGEIRDGMRSFYQLFLSVRDLPCPTLAAVNGAAIGAGLCVALACDVRIAARDAKLGLNFTQLGLHPGMGATWTLPRLVGPAHAAEILFSSRVFSGSEAAEIGLVSRAIAPADVLPAARALAAEIAAAAPLAVRGVKRALRRSEEASLEDQLDFEAAGAGGLLRVAGRAGRARRRPRAARGEVRGALAARLARRAPADPVLRNASSRVDAGPTSPACDAAHRRSGWRDCWR